MAAASATATERGGFSWPQTPTAARLAAELAHRHPCLQDTGTLIAGGDVLVNGFPPTNPASLVSPDDSLTIRTRRPLRGGAKLAHAITAFGVEVDGCLAVDIGAAAGGFTQVLLNAGASRVYGVDAGHGQLRGQLRQDPRVVNSERTNVGQLRPELVPEPVDLMLSRRPRFVAWARMAA